ncbi:TPA: hypothetical protein NHT78_000697 [Morganella morganii]|nr:hypothetical protein [Morganella morganii]
MELTSMKQPLLNAMDGNQITAESKNIFQKVADKVVAVVNSCRTFSTECSTQKDHNIQKACERLAALTLVSPETYITGTMKESAVKLDIVLPGNTASVSRQTDTSAAASIGKLSMMKTSQCTAQELYNMLSKQQSKSGTSEEMNEKIKVTLDMVDKKLSHEDIIKAGHAGIVENGVDRIRKNIMSNIIMQHRMNEINNETGLNDKDISELELARNTAFELKQ